MNVVNKIYRLFFRSLPQNKTFTFLNGVGLSVGLALCLMVVFYVKYEVSFDRQYTRSGSIYRLNGYGHVGSDSLRAASTPIPTQQIFAELKPEVENYTQIIKGAVRLVKYGQKSFAEHRMIYGDTSFFKIFDVSFLSGNPITALNDTLSVVVSEQTAIRYFGFENPMGKTIETDNGLKLKVTGVCEDQGSNTHMQFDLVASRLAIEKLIADTAKISQWKSNWLNFNSYNYAVLRQGVDPRRLETRFNVLAAPHIDAKMAESSDEVRLNNAASFKFSLQDIRDIHLNNTWDNELTPTGDMLQVQLAIGLAILILFITVLNFVNLTTSHLKKRMHEVQVRKLAGASKQNLFRQFMAESFVNTMMAFFIALAILELSFPFFNQFLQLGIKLGQVRGWSDLAIALTIAFAVGGLTGLLPAIFFTKNFSGDGTGASRRQNPSFYLRALLVSFQVAGSIALLILTVGIWHQIRSVRKADLGFNPNNLLVVERSNALGDSLADFKKELLRLPQVESVALTSFVPGDQLPVIAFKATSDSSALLLWNLAMVDADFAKTFQMPMKLGRFFEAGDTSSLVVTQFTKQEYKIHDDLATRFQTFEIDNKPMRLVGVTNNIYIQSLKEPIAPLAFLTMDDGYKYVVVKFKQDQYKQTTSQVADVWDKFTKGQPFDSFLLTDRINKFYDNDRRLGRLVLILSVFALFMAALSVVGLSVFSICVSNQDLAVHKQQGAGSHHLTLLGVIRLAPFLFGGVLLSIPLAWQLLALWIRPFLVQSQLPVYVYVVAVGVVSLFAFTLVYQQTNNEVKRLGE